MKTRTQTKQKFYGKTSIAFSNTYHSTAVLESELEVDFFNLMNFEGFADDFQMQPDSIRYKVGNKWRRYTADAVFVIDGFATFVEIKYKKDADKPELIIKHEILKRHFNDNGSAFLVMTEEDILCGHRASNLRYLLPAISHISPVEELGKLLQLTNKTSMHITKFYKLQSKHNARDCLVRRAIAHKLITCNLALHFNDLQLDFTGFLERV